MSKSFKKDLTGQRFGRLTVLGFVPTEDDKSHWRCKCDCGNECTVAMYNLVSEHTQSCGCKLKKFIKSIRYSHGLSNTRLYKIWKDMKKRCYNPNQTHYKDYGGRGITVCDEWKDDFQTFYDWAMSNGYSDKLTIDRINVNGNYTPENCRWATRKMQTRNRNITRIVEYKGQKMSLSEAAQQSNIPYGTLQNRYNRGDRGERLFRPIDTKHQRKNK